ncbi:MAG TPA: 1-deoxy-D-xylulose-5-phosphate reductoisomerase [Alphaproteobacteria bacterium]|nr:1-deoxy-D-xylulose-5-phosphate reductoisomerase [Alphaproteobacteria bacterium]
MAVTAQTFDGYAREAPVRNPAPKRITVLGSTGSVGRNTLDLVERNPAKFRVEALTANTNVALLAEQACRHRARLAVIAEESSYGELKTALSGTGIEAAAGAASVVEAARRPSDWVMAAIVGAAGLEPTLAAVERGAVVGLANKESLVCAGDIVMKAVGDNAATLLPVDSEHSAIFQVLDYERSDAVARIILTASGGPFRTMARIQLDAVTPAEAVAHPNWSMGAKISVDSATMMNKGLEVIEASHLFPVPKERIEIVVHPQSVIHSMVEYVDGSVLAQLGTPDMRTPIAVALAWPERMTAPSKRLDFASLSDLTFEAPDLDRFPALRVAREALYAGGSAPTTLNAANEVAVEAFLAGRIRFLDIVSVVEAALNALPNRTMSTLDDVRAADTAAREVASTRVHALVLRN